MGRRRNRSVILRLSDEEMAALSSAVSRSGLTRQEYLERLISDAYVPDAECGVVMRDMSRQLSEICLQIRKIGVNLNQIARIANTYGTMPDTGTLADMIEELNTLWRRWNQSWQFLRRQTARRRVRQD